jgi:hypothetical protein
MGACFIFSYSDDAEHVLPSAAVRKKEKTERRFAALFFGEFSAYRSISP